MTTNNALAATLVATLIGLGGCTNPEVPAGHEGYIHHVPLLFGQMEYRESLPGPASTGVSWRLYSTNIDMRERNYPEEFELLSSDDLKVTFEVNTRVRLRPGSVKEIVEDWGGEDWYEWNVKEPLRTILRREVMNVSATDIQLKTESIGRLITDSLLEKYKDTPIDIQSVDIGRFEFPEKVTQAIQEKIAKQQEFQRQAYILEKTRKEAAIRVLDALKLAKKQRIISETLNSLYLQYRAVQVYRSLAQSSNKTVIMLPSTAEGTGMPQVLAEGKSKVLTAEDETFLEEIEKRYMDKVKGGPVKSDSSSSQPDSPAPEQPEAPSNEPAQPAANDGEAPSP